MDGDELDELLLLLKFLTVAFVQCQSILVSDVGEFSAVVAVRGDGEVVWSHALWILSDYLYEPLWMAFFELCEVLGLHHGLFGKCLEVASWSTHL